MEIIIHYFILVTGLMNSGKSTLISEYLHNFKSVEFTPPSINVRYKGLDFEFIDSVFALEQNDHNFNFYELDAPTISKWFQFVNIANAVVIVYNHNPKIEYGTHENLANAVFSHVTKDIPIIFVLNNFKNLEEAQVALRDKYELNKHENNNIIITSVEKGEPFFDRQYGNRVKLKSDQLENMFSTIINSLSN